MSQILEAAMVIPLVIIIFIVFSLQIPRQYFQIYETGKSYLAIKENDSDVYSQVKLNGQTQALSNPQRLLESLHQVDDIAIDIKSLIEGKTNE